MSVDEIKNTWLRRAALILLIVPLYLLSLWLYVCNTIKIVTMDSLNAVVHTWKKRN